MAVVIVFGSSFILALCIFTLKYFELRRGKSNFLLRFVSRFDSRAEELVAASKFRILQLIQSARYVVLVHIPAVIDRAIEKTKESILQELDARRNMLRGQKDISNKGAVSFFLKKIDENKRNGERGEINEEM